MRPYVRGSNPWDWILEERHREFPRTMQRPWDDQQKALARGAPEAPDSDSSLRDSENIDFSCSRPPVRGVL